MTINLNCLNFAYLSVLAISIMFYTPARDVPPEAYFLTQLDYDGMLASYRIVGARKCKIGRGTVTCPIIENIFPVGILRVTRGRDGATPLAESHTPYAGYGSNLHYTDVHVYSFVPQNPFKMAFTSPWPEPILPVLFTESAGRHWKDAGFKNSSISKKHLILCEKEWKENLNYCAGRWGSYYPITGYFNHHNPTVEAVIQALRAARGAHESIPGANSKYRYTPRTGHYIQMLKPTRTKVMKIGIDDIEKIRPAKDGDYLFVHYGIFRSCPPCSFKAELQPARVR